MSALLDSSVQAAVPAAVPAIKAGATPGNDDPVRALARAKRGQEHSERLERWKAISEAGGIDGWVRKQLQSKGALVDTDPARLADSEKGKFKAAKKLEAEERRALKKLAWQAYTATHITHLGAGVHWDERGGVDRFDLEQREERAKSNELPELKGPDELAKALDVSISRLRWLAFHREVDTGSHYRQFTIPKRDGSARTITAPRKYLKDVQRWALRNVAEKLPVHAAAHGFLASRSIVTNATVHAGAQVLVKVDVKDFFPTVTWRRVRGLFRKAGLSEQVATLLALLTTEAPREAMLFRGKVLHVARGPRALPQGAPSSPAITNALCLRLDRRMSGLARTLGFRYTRYADDLAFSFHGDEKKKTASGRPPVGTLLKGVKAILSSEGFELHPNKTRVLGKGLCQRVTGLVVNRAPEGVPVARVPREVQRRLRAALHHREKGRPGKEGESLAQLKGMAAFVFMTDAARGRHFLDRVAELEKRSQG